MTCGSLKTVCHIPHGQNNELGIKATRRKAARGKEPLCSFYTQGNVILVTMTFSRSAGGIVLGPNSTVALVKTRGGNSALLFPKGHVEEGETDEQAARREIEEETGLSSLEFLDDLGSYTRPRIRKDGSLDESEQKEIHMFLFAAPPNASLAPTREIDHAEWVPYREVAEKIGNTQDRAWFATVFDRVREAVQRD